MDGIAAKLGRSRVRTAPEHPFRGAPIFGMSSSGRLRRGLRSLPPTLKRQEAMW